MKRLLSPTIKKKLLTLLEVWRTVTTIIIFAILLPIFLAANSAEQFFLIMLSISAIVIGVTFIVRQALKKKYQKYVDHALIFIVLGASIITIEAFLIETLHHSINIVLLTISALSYAYGLHKLGISYVLFI